MKNFVEINRTPSGVKKNDFKSIVQSKARWLLTFCALLSLGVGQVWARTFSGGEIIYFTGGDFKDSNGSWNYDYTRLLLRSSSGSNTGAALVSLSAVTDNSGYYQAIIPAGTWNYMILVRLNATTIETFDWSNVWNQTWEIGIDGTANLFTGFKENTTNHTWKWMIPKGATFYFDKTKIGTWGANYYLRIGRSDHNKAYSGFTTLVTGTDRLYKYTMTENYVDYSAFVVSNNDGWTNGNSIYNIGNGPGDSHYISHQISHVGSTTLTGLDYTFIPTGTTTSGDGGKCTYYASTNYQGKNIFTITNNTTDNGTVRLSYYDENNTKHYVEEGQSIKVLPTTIVTLEATPASGYSLTNVKLWDSEGSNRDWTANGNKSNQYIVRCDVTFEGKFEPTTTKTFLVRDEHGWGAMSVHAWNLFTGANTIDYPINDAFSTGDGGCNGTWYVVNISNEYYYCELYKTNDIGANAGDVFTKYLSDGAKYHNTNAGGYILYSANCTLTNMYYVETFDGVNKYHSNCVSTTADYMSFYANLQNGSAWIKLKTFNGTDGGWTYSSDLKSLFSSVFTPSANEPGNIFTATLNEDKNSLTNIDVYNGKTYIRTDLADGGWYNYLSHNDTMVLNPEYRTATNNEYSHYYMHWAPTSNNVKFDIANQYNAHLTGRDEGFAADEYTNDAGVLAYNSNVRFMWNKYTNTVSRAYISGSSTASDRYLVLSCSDAKLKDENEGALNISGLNPNEALFKDDGNWVYELDAKVYPGAQIKLTSDVIKSGGSRQTQYFKGDADSYVTLMDGNVKSYQSVRIVYDFKTNHLVSSWVPSGDPISADLTINTDVMLLRKHQSDAKQIRFTGSDITLSEVLTVYGVMQFNKWVLNNKSEADGHADLPVANSKSAYWRDLYWISFPFSVNLSDVFGFGTYGTHWIIEYYDGKGRAKNGFWVDSEPNWKFVTPAEKNSFVLEANVGYILALDLDLLGTSSSIWNNSVEDVYLYFPSTTEVGNLTQTTHTVLFPDQNLYECIINRPTPDGNRTIKDSYWHCIGVPSFADNAAGVTTNGSTAITWSSEDMPFLYQWNAYTNPGSDAANTLTAQNTANFNFKSMYSYLVQYSGAEMHWSAVTNVAPPTSVAARQTESQDKNYSLSLMQNEIEEDHALLRFTDNTNVTNAFEFNQDLSKEYNSGKANIWTVTADTVEVAGNSMPKPLQTTLVPVGVKVVANGEYTFSMPEGTNGENVYLIDYAYNTRTNLGLTDYTVNLTTGTYEGRFALEFSPIQEMPTAVENVDNEDLTTDKEGVRKVLVGGRLYILRDGKAYDATGALVE